MTELEQDQFNALLLQNERLKEELDETIEAIKEGDKEIEQLQADKAELVEALEQVYIETII